MRSIDRSAGAEVPPEASRYEQGTDRELEYDPHLGRDGPSIVDRAHQPQDGYAY
jgi:hypothetical protein